MQDAYVSESNEAGPWNIIGYKMPSSNNFKYDSALTAKTSVSALKDTEDWVASAKVTMNECTSTTGIWKLQLNQGSDGNGVSYKAVTPTCGVSLTPTFDKIGQGS